MTHPYWLRNLWSAVQFRARTWGLLPLRCTLCTMPLTGAYWREEAARPFGGLMCFLVQSTGMCVACAVAEEKRIHARRAGIKSP